MELVLPGDFTDSLVAPRRYRGNEFEYDSQMPGDRELRDRMAARTSNVYYNDHALLRPGIIARSHIRTFRNRDKEGKFEQIFWLVNGGNLHMDVNRIEYSSPETLDARTGAASGLAGMRLVALLGATHGKATIRRHASTTIGDSYKSLGPQQSYLAPATIAASDDLPPLLDSFDATRAWAWGGTLGPDGRELCQKAKGIGRVTSLTAIHRISEKQKQMGWIKIADPDVLGGDDPKDWARIERRVLDGLFCRVAAFTAEAMGSAVIRIKEHQNKLRRNQPLKALFLDQPIEVLHAASEDLTLRQIYKRVDGSTITAIELQQLYNQYLRTISKEVQLPEDELLGMAYHTEVCDRLLAADILAGELEPILGWCDFGDRFNFLQRKQPIADLHSYNNLAVRRNLTWNEITEGGIGMKYWDRLYGGERTKDKLADPIGDYLIRHYTHSPPTEGRARVRGEAVAHPSLRSHKVSSISWTALQHPNGYETTLPLYGKLVTSATRSIPPV